MTTNSLLEMALNGMGLGTKISDVEQMYADHKQQGDKAAEIVLLDLVMSLEDLKRAERQQAGSAHSLATALARFQDNPTVHNAEWLTKYGAEVERYAREAHNEYMRVGKTWRLWVALSDKF